MDNNQCVMKRKMDALDFAIFEIELYLDTHPCDAKALTARQVYYQKREQCLHEYERLYGPYVVTASDVSDRAEKWTWVHGPWPWEGR